MHSINTERTSLVSPKKRSLSRGMSEDESLRSIITMESETTPSSRRLNRSDSRADTLKRTPRARSDSQHSDQDLYLELPSDMVDLQTSYQEVLQELRSMEVERETLLFQVDVLQDTLEGVEELLAESQREAGDVTMELERERDSRRKLEAMVQTLMEEIEALREERNNTPVNIPVLQGGEERNVLQGGEETQQTSSAAASSVESSSSSSSSHGGGGGGAEKSPESIPSPSSSSSSSSPTKLQRMARGKSFEQSATLALDNPTAEDGVLRRPCCEDQELLRRPPCEEEGGLQRPCEEEGRLQRPCEEEGRLQRPCEEEGGLQRPCEEEGRLQRPCEEEGRLQRPCEEEGRLQRPCEDNDTDSVSMYEDASAETPEMDRMFPPPSPSPLDDDADVTVTAETEDGGSPTSPNAKNPNESCVVS